MNPKIYTVDGFTGTMQEIGAHYGINYRTLATRLRAGWSLERAVSTPVDKLKSVKLPYVLEIGKVRAVPDVIEKRFGVCLGTLQRKDSALTISHIRKYSEPVFYEIDKSYTGSLQAISEDFGCPLSELKAGLKKGIQPKKVLEDGGYMRKDTF